MKLNPRQEKFCQLYAIKGNASAAYREAYEGALGAGTSGYRMLQNAVIAKRIEELTGEVAKKYEADREELIAWWTEVRDTPIGEIDQNHPLAQEYQHSEAGIKIKMPSKEQAAKEIARLTKSYEAIEVNLNASDEVVSLLQTIAGVRDE